MTDPVIRCFRPEDSLGAARLWEQVFGDPASLVLEFLDIFSAQPDFCRVAEADGRIVAAAYCLDGPELILPNQPPISGTYLYAVATDPAWRKLGLAAKLCRDLRDLAFHRGIRYVFTKPAEESLYHWYEEKIGAVPALPCGKLRFTAPVDTASLPVAQFTPTEYAELREALLKNTPHVRLPESFIRWEHLLHETYGGAFLNIGGWAVDVFSDGAQAEIHELLSPPHSDYTPEDIAGAVMSHYGVSTVSATIPNGTEHYISCATATGNIPPIARNAWFGPVFG